MQTSHNVGGTAARRSILQSGHFAQSQMPLWHVHVLGSDLLTSVHWALVPHAMAPSSEHGAGRRDETEFVGTAQSAEPSIDASGTTSVVPHPTRMKRALANTRFIHRL